MSQNQPVVKVTSICSRTQHCQPFYKTSKYDQHKSAIWLLPLHQPFFSNFAWLHVNKVMWAMSGYRDMRETNAFSGKRVLIPRCSNLSMMWWDSAKSSTYHKDDFCNCTKCPMQACSACVPEERWFLCRFDAIDQSKKKVVVMSMIMMN